MKAKRTPFRPSQKTPGRENQGESRVDRESVTDAGGEAAPSTPAAAAPQRGNRRPPPTGRAHRGAIKVESEVGKGTTFWLTLPVAQRQATTGQLKRQTGRLTFKPDKDKQPPQ